MTWRAVGVAIAGPYSQEIAIGRLSGRLTSGYLPLRGRVINQGGSGPLSFAIVSLRDDEGTRPADGVKWWPRPDPSVVQLGPAIGETIAGLLLLRPRSYNLQWLRAGLPAPWWGISWEAWLPEGTAAPGFTPSGFEAGGQSYTIHGPAQGPAGARALAPNG